ncbi:MAG: hypothetical protein WBG86_03470, partial [Polyangiales bacterium]
MQRLLLIAATCALTLGLGACGGDGSDPTQPPALESCDFDSTFDAIQATIFEDGGCAQSACHGEGYE